MGKVTNENPFADFHEAEVDDLDILVSLRIKQTNNLAQVEALAGN